MTIFFRKILFFRRIIADYIGSSKVNGYVNSSKVIRTCRDSDLVRIQDLYHSCFGGKNCQQIVDYSKQFRNTFYVFEKNGMICAYIGFYVHFKFVGLKLVQNAVCYSGCVERQEQGKGLYTKIYEICLSELKNNNVQVVHVCVRKNNLASLRVHQKLGFEIVNDTRNFCRGDDFLLFELKLNH
jgi:L-amino acid N-acyltransferase YncA